jgi:hypothetical protein
MLVRTLTDEDTVPLTEAGGQRGSRSRDLLPWSLNVGVAETRRREMWMDHTCDGDLGDAVMMNDDGRGDWLRLMSTAFHCAFKPVDGLHCDGEPGAVAVEAQATLLQKAALFSKIHDGRPLPPSKDWERILRGRGVDYGGNELLLPQSITAAQIEPGLPPRGFAGSIRAEDVCEGFTREMILNPSLVLRQGAWAAAPPRAKVWVTEDAWEGVVRLLHERQLIEPWERPLKSPSGELVLNGSFGVQKKDATVVGRDGRTLPLLRFIVNLIPSNASQDVLQGDVRHLPTAGQMSAFGLEAEQVFLTSLTDRSAFFYIFRLPICWRPFMVFSKRAKWRWLGIDRDGDTFVALTVIAMGWSQAVSIYQHIHRNLLKSGVPRPLPAAREVRRSRPFPLCLSAEHMTWMAYIDDLRLVETMPWQKGNELRGSISAYLEDALANYSFWNVPGNPTKDVRREPVVISLGERLDGYEGRRDLPPGFFQDLIDLTLWVFQKRDPSQKLVQILMGRWARVLGVRRAMASCFDRAWRWALKARPGRVPADVVDEFLTGMSLLPTAHQDFRMPIDGLVTASDASKKGGAVVASCGLTDFGRQELQRSHEAREEAVEDELLLVTYGDELGASRRAFDLLGCKPAAALFGGISREGWRVVCRAWPDVEKLVDISCSPRTFLRDLHLRVDRVNKVCFLYCGRQGASSLFCRLHDSVVDEFKPKDVLVIVEGNQSDFAEMKNLLSRYDWQELEFSALPTSGVQRTRNFLISHRIDHQWGNKVVRVDLDGGKRHVDRWLQPPWVPGSLPLKLPDFLKPMPRRHRPLPFGDWAHLDQATLNRWEADKWQWPPEHYQEDRLLWKGRQDGRHPSADERDVLLGFSRGHTAPAVASSMLKSGGERVRLALVAHGIHAEHLAWLLSRAGKAKGWLSADCSWVNILARIVADVPYVPTFAPKGMRQSSDEQADADFVKRVVTAVDHRGSDVRLNVGQLLTPSCWPRQSFKPHFWRWRHLFSWSWKKQAHINVLEAAAGGSGCTCSLLAETPITEAVRGGPSPAGQASWFPSVLLGGARRAWSTRSRFYAI